MRTYEKGISIFLIGLLSISFFWGLSSNSVYANQLTPYVVSGIVDSNGAAWHSIYNITKNDLVLISIEAPYNISSTLYYPDQIVCVSIPDSLSHVYKFTATVSGNYLLQIDSVRGVRTSYSGDSSNNISAANQLTPNVVSGIVDSNGAAWHSIYNITKNDLVLISIEAPYNISSTLYYPDNQTICKSIPDSLSHVYKFTATVSGNYLLQIDSVRGVRTSYSGYYGSLLSSTPLPNPTISPSLITPSPIVSATAGNSKILNASELFGVEANNATYTWNFGDGTTPQTTISNTVAHSYQQTGTFNITLIINQTIPNLIQTFNIPITVNPSSGSDWRNWIIAIVVAIIGAVAVIIAAIIKVRGNRITRVENRGKIDSDNGKKNSKKPK